MLELQALRNVVDRDRARGGEEMSAGSGVQLGGRGSVGGEEAGEGGTAASTARSAQVGCWEVGEEKQGPRGDVRVDLHQFIGRISEERFARMMGFREEGKGAKSGDGALGGNSAFGKDKPGEAIANIGTHSKGMTVEVGTQTAGEEAGAGGWRSGSLRMSASAELAHAPQTAMEQLIAAELGEGGAVGNEGGVDQTAAEVEGTLDKHARSYDFGRLAFAQTSSAAELFVESALIPCHFEGAAKQRDGAADQRLAGGKAATSTYYQQKPVTNAGQSSGGGGQAKVNARKGYDSSAIDQYIRDNQHAPLQLNSHNRLVVGGLFPHAYENKHPGKVVIDWSDVTVHGAPADAAAAEAAARRAAHEAQAWRRGVDGVVVRGQTAADASETRGGGRGGM